jgi:hypothetical protein
LRLNTGTTIASKTTTVGPQMPPFSSSGSGAFAGSCSGGGVSTGGAGAGVSISGGSTVSSSTGALTFSSSFTIAL